MYKNKNDNTKSDKNELSTEEKKFRGYINEIIAKYALLYFKRQQKLYSREKNIIDDEAYNDLIEDAMQKYRKDDIDLELFIKDMLNKLNSHERNIIILNVYGGYSQKEIAERLNMWDKSVSRIKNKAKEKMKKYLEEGN